MLNIPFDNDGAARFKTALQHRQWLNKGPDTEVSAYLCDRGLKVHFTVREKDPYTTVFTQTDPMSMVCRDSAVEVFLAFPDSAEAGASFAPKLEHCLYCNIEINSAGACYAKYGRSRKNRTACSAEQIRSFEINCKKESEFWECDVLIPTQFIIDIAGFNAFGHDCVWAMNLYKISENKDTEHYISMSRIESEKPNFHLPEFFALCKAGRDS